MRIPVLVIWEAAVVELRLVLLREVNINPIVRVRFAGVERGHVRIQYTSTPLRIFQRAPSTTRQDGMTTFGLLVLFMIS